MRFPTNIKNINLQKAIIIICCCLFLAQCFFNDASAFAKTEKTTKSSSSLQLNNKSERESEVAANKIFHTSLKLFQDGEYWNCAQELIIIMDFYPQFDKMDKVVNYLGHCLFQEELTMASIRMFNYLLKKYKKSEHIPDALLGLERAFYQQNDYKRTLQAYYLIIKKAYNKKILGEARYIAGKCHYRLKNYDMAISVLKKVDNRSDFYDGALYSIALSYLKKSNVAVAVDYFREVTTLPIISGERRKLVDNARFTL